MTTKRNFLKEFFKDKQMVGAISPSTKFLGEKMLSSVDFEKDRIIVELGPGTGVFTDLIISRMHPDAKLIVFELNERFCEALKNRIKDPRVKIIHDSAENISKYLDEGEQCDVVVSSLPLMVFPAELRNDVIQAAYDSLRKSGMYVQFQYSLQSKKLLESVFKSVKVKFTLKNFPPAFVYVCLKD
jgi:phospholipid N-methyltransferase